MRMGTFSLEPQQIGAIWCILGHILAFKPVCYFFKVKLKKIVAFTDKSEKKTKKTLNVI